MAPIEGDTLDMYAGRDGGPRRLDPRMTVGLTAAGILAVLLSGRAWFPLAVMVVALARLVWVGVPPGTIVRALIAPLALAAVVGLRQEDLAAGGLLVARSLAAVGLMLTLGATTPAYQVFAVLSWARLPRTWVEIALLMHRHVFTLQDSAREIVAAQRWRLGYSTAGRALSSAGTLAGMVLERSLDKAERVHEALVSRGYRGELPRARLGRLPWRDLASGGARLAVLTLTYLVLERGW